MTTDQSAQPVTAEPAQAEPLGPDELKRIDAWWRPCNYLSVGIIYLRGNPLLKEGLAVEYVKHTVCSVTGGESGPFLRLGASESLYQTGRPRHDLHGWSRSRRPGRARPDLPRRAGTARRRTRYRSVAQAPARWHHGSDALPAGADRPARGAACSQVGRRPGGIAIATMGCSRPTRRCVRLPLPSVVRWRSASD
jgi:hypothetical protein